MMRLVGIGMVVGALSGCGAATGGKAANSCLDPDVLAVVEETVRLRNGVPGNGRSITLSNPRPVADLDYGQQCEVTYTFVQEPFTHYMNGSKMPGSTSEGTASYETNTGGAETTVIVHRQQTPFGI